MDETRLIQITRQSAIAETDFYPAISRMYERMWEQLLPAQILTDGLSARRSRSFITPEDAQVPDCQTCGACCIAMLCVGVRPDEKVADDDYWNITVATDAGDMTVDRFMRRSSETFMCSALEIEDGERAVCRIYADRPRICRDFEAGSDKCHALRRAFGYEPFLTLDEMSEALAKLERRNAAKGAGADTIRFVRFIETGDGDFEIMATMRSGRTESIARFDPIDEVLMQFEFDGLTIAQAEATFAARRTTCN